MEELYPDVLRNVMSENVLFVAGKLTFLLRMYQVLASRPRETASQVRPAFLSNSPPDNCYCDRAHA